MSTEETGTSRSSSSTASASTHSNTISHEQSIEKVDGSMAMGQSNYNAWRFRIIRILKEKDLLSVIEEENVSSAAKDNQAFTIITLNIKDSQIPHIQDTRTARKAWEALEEVHKGIGMNGMMILMQHVWALKMTEGQDMSKYLNQFRKLANQLRGLLPKGKQFDDSELLTILTLSLPDSYKPLVMALQSRSDVGTFDMMACRLLQELARRHVGPVTHKESDTTLHGSHTAFTANHPLNTTHLHQGRGSFQGNGSGRGGILGSSTGMWAGNQVGNMGRAGTGSSTQRPPSGTRCYYSGKLGHWKRDCYKCKSEESGNSTGGRIMGLYLFS